MRLLEIITTIAFVTSGAMAEETCKQNLSFDKAPAKDCLSKKTANDIKQCLDKHVPGLTSVNAENANVRLQLSKPICIYGSLVHPGPGYLYVNIARSGQILDVSDFRTPVTIGTVTYSGYSACGWTANGKRRLPLIATFSFIPTNAKIKVETANCQEGTIDPGNSVELQEAANICDATLPKGTQFFYQPDGAYHFIALSNTKMLYADPNSESETMVIAKGKRYRNFDPAKSPCIWSETPADVLKSFQDGTSD